jgi:hypothetical protein
MKRFLRLRSSGGERLPQFFKLAVAAVIAGFGDESGGFIGVLLRLGKLLFTEQISRLRQMVIGQVKAHAAASGEAIDLVEVALGTASEQSEGQVL